jgi:predicted ribosomally synthesized peptide with SipW-like signal peptide
MMKTLNASKSNLTKFAVGALAASLLAIGGVATVANFTDSATSTVTVTSGNIDLELGAAKTFPINLGTIMKPGETVVKSIVVTNNGTIPLTYTAATGSIIGPTLAGNINVTMRDMTVPATPVVIPGTPKMSTVALPAKTIAAGGTQTVELTFTWPNGTPAVDNPLQGISAGSTLTFSATQ